MTDTLHNDPLPTRLAGSRANMEPLYERLLSQQFQDSASAVEFCRAACAEYGFTVKQESSANRNIYIYCSREGLPDSKRNPRPSPQRKRPSKRCDCRWRVVLSELEGGHWEFRKSSNPASAEHNHDMMTAEEMTKNWPSEVSELIHQLARDQIPTHDIRDMVRKRFPDLTWNERRFYNRLTEERKRIRQRSVVEHVRRLVSVSSRLAAVAASSRDWTQCVETELGRMIEHYCHLLRIPPEMADSLIDLDTEEITLVTGSATATQMGTDRLVTSMSSPSTSSTSSSSVHRLSISEVASPLSMSPPPPPASLPNQTPSKKRKSIRISTEGPKGTHTLLVPSYTIHTLMTPLMRSSSLDTASQTSSQRTYSDPTVGMETFSSPVTQASISSASFASVASPTSPTATASALHPRPPTSDFGIGQAFPAQHEGHESPYGMSVPYYPMPPGLSSSAGMYFSMDHPMLPPHHPLSAIPSGAMMQRLSPGHVHAEGSRQAALNVAPRQQVIYPSSGHPEHHLSPPLHQQSHSQHHHHQQQQQQQQQQPPPPHPSHQHEPGTPTYPSAQQLEHYHTMDLRNRSAVPPVYHHPSLPMIRSSDNADHPATSHSGSSMLVQLAMPPSSEPPPPHHEQQHQHQHQHQQHQQHPQQQQQHHHPRWA